MAILVQIAIKQERHAPMVRITAAPITLGNGIEGDINGQKGKRQITALTTGQWRDACREVGADLPWTTRRANLLIGGMTFSRHDIGRRLCIGYEVVIEITGELTPCNRMDEAHPGLQKALRKDFRGGITCKVIRGGILVGGNPVSWEN